MSSFASAANLRLVGWDGFKWLDLSNAATASGNTAGSTLSEIMINGIGAIGIGSAANILDITLSDFSVTGKDCNASISFTTTHEDPNTSINIEQSANGGLSFTKIIALTSQYPDGGNYHYTASQNSGIACLYRLKIINADGRYRYSAVKTLTTRCGNAGTNMSFYPNPVVGNIQASLRFTTAYNGKATLTVLNNLGQQLVSQQANIIAGDNTIMLNTSAMSAGLYYVKLADANNNIIGNTQKLIKQ